MIYVPQLFYEGYFYCKKNTLISLKLITKNGCHGSWENIDVAGACETKVSKNQFNTALSIFGAVISKYSDYCVKENFALVSTSSNVKVVMYLNLSQAFVTADVVSAIQLGPFFR